MRTNLNILLLTLFTLTLPATAQPAFSLAWSEYPSWSAFGVADVVGIIDGDKGKLGRVEKKWNVDIVLRQADYDPCLVMYGAKQIDAVCITNMDILNPSLTRQSVAILPTSTSHGADACIVGPDITDIKQLKGKPVYGLAKTVSEYTFYRNLELAGENPKEYRFVNRDPAAAALGFQQKRSGVDAIVVWNPFVLETLNKRKDARVLFDSTRIPGEIIDMVVISQESLAKPGGEAFACATIEAFYELNKMLADEKTRDRTLLALGEKFSNLDLQSMRKVVQQTKFYDTPDAALKLLESKELTSTMDKVAKFCLEADITPKKPTVAFGAQDAENRAANLRFDPTYINKVEAKK
jgi:NitT/TauT family transport system substrate-binding protein